MAFAVLEFVPGVSHALYSLFRCCGCAVCVFAIACLPDLDALARGEGGDASGTMTIVPLTRCPLPRPRPAEHSQACGSACEC